MKVTYIGHSGFLVETDIANLLFDYSEGKLPEVDSEKPFIVFVSHAHPDHYNSAVFGLAKQYKNIRYFLSNDVHISEEVIKEYKLTKAFINNKVAFVPAGIHRIVPFQISNDMSSYLILETLKSTDCGVAFLLNVDGKGIYHAGDLNYWVWEEDTKQQFNNMSAMFKRALEGLSGQKIFLAFAPLDPRQGRFYKAGMEYLLNAADITYAVPMHLWGQYDLVDRYEAERVTHTLPTKILKFSKELESMDL